MSIASGERWLKYFVFVLVLILSPTSCIPTVNIVDTAKLDNNEGVMVSTIVTNFCGTISIINLDNAILPSAVISVRPGENFRVMSLPAGRYSWRGIYLENNSSEFRGRYNFEIKAQSVNYIGDLLIEVDKKTLHKTLYQTALKYTMVFIDHGDETSQYLQKAYPQLSSSHDFVRNLTTDIMARESAPEPTLDVGNSRPPEWHTPGTRPPGLCDT